MPAARDPSSIRAELEANYHQIACELLRQQLATMHVVYGTFGGDSEAFFILGVIAQRTAEHQDFRASPWAEWRSDPAPSLPSLTTNIHSVAQSTGIPEETVRRKVLALIERGWIAREGNRLSYTAEGAQAMGPVRGALLDLAVQNYRVVAALLERGAAKSPKMGV